MHLPDYKLNIIEEEEFSDSINTVFTRVEKVKQSGKFVAFDGINIYYEYFLAGKSNSTVVIVHGLSEFTKKFYELAYYFLNQGFNVFMYDQRCHGLSDRLTSEKDLLHVDNFSDYEKDLTFFMEKVVLKVVEGPIYLFAHSMGGAVSAFYLAKNNDKIKKAVLSAPMFEPIVGNVPFAIARAGVKVAKVFVGSKRKFLSSKEFNPDIEFNYVPGLSKARFEHNMKLRRENPNYQSTPMSFGWVSNSLCIGKKLLKPRVVGNIDTPVLIISAGADEMVNNEIQKTFYKKCKNCKFESIENATHAILAGDEGILSRVLNLVLGFYS